jgi:hypothetical protein
VTFARKDEPAAKGERRRADHQGRDRPSLGRAEVVMTLTARDEGGNEGRNEPFAFRLPERAFTKPLAKALVEQRRNLALDASTVAGCAGGSAVDGIARCLSSAADQQIASAEFPLLLRAIPSAASQVRVPRLWVRHKFLDLSLIPGKLLGANVPSTSENTAEHLNSSARPVMTTDHRDHPRCDASCGRPLPTARRRRSVRRFRPDRSPNPPS